MSESVFARVQRLLSAKVEDTVDKMETAGGEGVMRESIREVDRAIDAFCQSQADAMVGGDGAMQLAQAIDKKVENAEAAFDRAMGGAGGVNFSRTDADTINKVAELDGLQKSSTVASRLAALKASKAA